MKGVLRKAYSDNFMSKKFGKRGVERFFPKVAKKRKPEAKGDPKP